MTTAEGRPTRTGENSREPTNPRAPQYPAVASYRVFISIIALVVTLWLVAAFVNARSAGAPAAAARSSLASTTV